MTSSETNEASSVCPEMETMKAVAKTLEVAQTGSTSESTIDLSEEHAGVFDYFSCEEAIKRLNDYLDSELDPAERNDVVRHLKVCGPCLERFHFEKSLIISLREKVRLTIAPLKLKHRLASIMKNGE